MCAKNTAPAASEQTRKVLVSPGFGAGWSTWIGSSREQKEFALFDEALIAAVEAGCDLGVPEKYNTEPSPDSPIGDFLRRFQERFPGEDPYLGGARDLTVEVVEGQFQVDEYDGSETVRTRSAEDWF